MIFKKSIVLGCAAGAAGLQVQLRRGAKPSQKEKSGEMERMTAAIVRTRAAPSMSAAFAEPKVGGSSAGSSLTPSSGPATSTARITPNSKNAGQLRRQAAALKKMARRGAVPGHRRGRQAEQQLRHHCQKFDGVHLHGDGLARGGYLQGQERMMSG